MRATIATVTKRLRRRPRSRGQSLVEFALILPVFLLFFGAVLDLGRVAAAQVTVTNVAREAAFQAAQTPNDFDNTQGCPAGGGTNKVICRALLEAKSSPISVSPSDVTLSCAPSCDKSLGNRVTVTVVGHFNLVTPILSAFFGGNQSLQFTASSTHQIAAIPVVASGTAAPTATPTPTPSASASASATPTPTPNSCVLPSAGFTYSTSPANMKAPVTINLTDTSTSTACGITSWFWVARKDDPDIGSVVWTDNVQNPTSHTFLVPGSYYVSLTVTNAAGDDTQGSAEIKVRNP